MGSAKSKLRQLPTQLGKGVAPPLNQKQPTSRHPSLTEEHLTESPSPASPMHDKDQPLLHRLASRADFVVIPPSAAVTSRRSPMDPAAAEGDARKRAQHEAEKTHGHMPGMLTTDQLHEFYRRAQSWTDHDDANRVTQLARDYRLDPTQCASLLKYYRPINTENKKEQQKQPSSSTHSST